MSEERSGMKIALDWLGGIAAFLTVVVYVMLLIHAKWAYLPDSVYNVLAVIRTWAPLVVVAITGLEFTSGKSIIFKILFLILLAVIVVAMFFPETWEKVVGLINSGNSN